MNDNFEVKLTPEELAKISNLGLAHIGDAVYELLIRTWLCRRLGGSAHGLHSAAIAYVNAGKQAELMEKVLPLLTEAETAAFRRGRNARVNTIPKHASLKDYHAATGLETLFGWLYLSGEKGRISELFDAMIEGLG